jgi:hypothetical protein
VLLDMAARALPVVGAILAGALHARLRGRSSRLYDMVSQAKQPAHLRKKGSMLLERGVPGGSSGPRRTTLRRRIWRFL